MPLPLYARGEFERKEDVTTTAVLLLASTKSRWNALALCLEKHSPTREAVNLTLYSDGRRLLHVAAATGNLSHVRLLSQTSTINEHQKHKLTPLHVACRDGKMPMIKGLLDLKAHLSAQDEFGRTPLWYACQQGRVEIVRLLISHSDGARVVNKADNDGNTPLHAACFSLRVEVVQLLVEHGGADIDARNNAEATPLLATLTQSKLDLRGRVLRVAVVLVENFATVPDKAEIEKHGSKRSSEELITLVACCEYWKKAGFLNADIPYDVLTSGAAAVQEFSTCNVENFRRHRICLVGQTEFGKTSLVKTIVNRVPSKTHYFVRTIGIELTSWAFKSDDGMFHQVTLWDFAGQDIYKPAHAPIFSEKTLFMLCIDLYAYKSKTNEAMTHHHAERMKILKYYAEANVLCWLRLIFARQPKARVVLVGTKSDLVDTREIDLVWREVDAQIRKWKSTFERATDVDTKEAIPCETQSIADHLESFFCPQKLVASSAQPEAIAPMITDLQNIVASSQVNAPLLSDVIDVLREVYRRRQVASKKADEERVYELIVPHAAITSNTEALEELHNLGEVLLLKDGSNDVYDDYVILDPKLIIDFIRQIVSHELVDPNDAGKDPRTMKALKLIRESGRVSHEFLAQLPLWRVCDKDLVVALKALLHRFQLIYPADGVDMASDPDVIVPLLWHHVGKIDPAPLSIEIALTKLKPPQNAPYPTHLRWEYELRQGIPPTLFMHLAVEAHVPGLNPTVCDECIDLHDEKGEVFLARISIPMDKKLGVRGQIVRLEVIAFDERVAWVKLKSFVCGMERVLEKYPGLKAGRYVEILPSEERVYRYNVDKSVKIMKSNGSGTYDETMLEWLPPLTIGIDWFVEKHWKETDEKCALQKLGRVEKNIDELKKRDDHSESYLRAVLKLSLQPERDRKFPGLWTLEKLQPEQGNPIVRIWFYSDLTGVCHQKEPIEIRVPNALLAEFGTSIKFGMSIASNLVPSIIDLGVLRAVVDHAKKVVDARVDDAIQIHNLIAKFNFAEQTGDHRVLTPKYESGLGQSQSIGLLEQLFQVSTMEGNPADYISSVSGLVRGSTINNHHVWASKAELETHQGVLEVYEGRSSQPTSPKLIQPRDDSPTEEFAVEVTATRVPKAYHEMKFFFIEHGMDRSEQYLYPAIDAPNRPDRNNRRVRYKITKTTFDQIQACELELQPYKKWILGIKKKVGQPTRFKFPGNCKVGDKNLWQVEWKDGEMFELEVRLLPIRTRESTSHEEFGIDPKEQRIGFRATLPLSQERKLDKYGTAASALTATNRLLIPDQRQLGETDAGAGEQKNREQRIPYKVEWHREAKVMLLLASVKGRWQALARLLAVDTPMATIRYADGRSLLHEAVVTGDVATVQWLCERIDPNQLDESGNTALHIACSFGRIECVKLLTANKADPGAMDQAGRVPLWHACRQSHVEFVRFLLTTEARMHAATPDHYGNTPLHAACSMHQFKIVQLLIEHGGVDINAANKRGLTPLLALFNGNMNMNDDRIKLDETILRIAMLLVENGVQLPNEDELSGHCPGLSSGDREVLCACIKHWRGYAPFGGMIPFEVFREGVDAVISFSQRAATLDGFFTRHRVCLVGQSKAGKTRLVDAVAKIGHHETHHYIPSGAIESTSWLFRAGNGKVHVVSLWDASEDMLTALHATVLPNNALFLICIDLWTYAVKIKEADAYTESRRSAILLHHAEETVLRWLRLIFARQPCAQVVLVGTKLDRVGSTCASEVISEVNRCIEYWKQKAKHSNRIHKDGDQQVDTPFIDQYKWLTVDIKTNKGVVAASKEIQGVISASEFGLEMSVVATNAVAHVIGKRREARKKHDSEKVETLIMLPRQISNDPEIVQSLHDAGDIVWFNKTNVGALSQFVIADPMLIAALMKPLWTIETFKAHFAEESDMRRLSHRSLCVDGRIPDALLKRLPIWKDCDAEVLLSFKILLHSFKLIYPDDAKEMTSDSNIVIPAFWKLKTVSTAVSLSKPIAYHKLVAPPDASYPTHLCWEYNFESGIPPTMLEELAVESHDPACRRNAADGVIDAIDLDGIHFIYRILCVKSVKQAHFACVVRFEVVAFDVQEAWRKLRFLVCAMERVLERYPGLIADRYVAELPIEDCPMHRDPCRCNWINVGEAFTKLEHVGQTDPNAHLGWIVPCTIGIDWLMRKQWRHLEPEHRKERRQMQEIAKEVRHMLRAAWKLSTLSDRIRKFPALWAFTLLQDHDGMNTVSVWFFSDLSGRCHHVDEPIKIPASDALLAKYGGLFKAGLSIVSNIDPTRVDLTVLKNAIGDFKKVAHAINQQPNPARGWINRVDFVQLTGDTHEIDTISEVPRRSPSINARLKIGLTALHMACREGKMQMIKGLLDLGADVSAEDEHGRTPFWYACQKGRIEIVRLLMTRSDKMKFVNKADNDGNTPLHAACLSLCVEIVQLLVEYGDADIEATNKAGATPLLATLTRGDVTFQAPAVRVAVVLVENFAEVPSETEILEHGSNLKDDDRLTLVECCKYWKEVGFVHADIPYSLLKAGATALQEFLACDAKDFRRHRVCLVGQTESGKTSLVKTIVNRVPSKTDYFVGTLGIELTSWTFRSNDGMFHQVTLWDFAGQDIYKPAHAPFFSANTLLILCIDLYAYKSKINESMTHDHAERTKILKHYAEANVLCWLRLIFARQPKVRVVLVGTKSDLVDTREIDVVWQEVDAQIRSWKSMFERDIDAYTKEALLFEGQTIAKHLDSFVFPQKLVASSAQPEAIEPMIAALQNIVASCEINPPLPSDAIDVLREVYRRRQDASKNTDVERVYELIVPHAAITSNTEALEELHNLGEVLLLKDGSNDVNDDYVILDPKLIIDCIRQIVSHELVDPNDAGKDPRTLKVLKLIRESGRVPHEFLAQLPLWRDCDEDLVVALKVLLQRFLLMYPADGLDMVSNPDGIVPLLWHHVGNVDPAPLSIEFSLTKLKPPQNAPYPTHLRWEYELRQGILPTLLTHLAVAAHVPGVTPILHEASIEVQDEKGEVFLARISIPMDKKLGVRGQIVRLEVIAFDERVAWVKLKSFVCGMERVLEKYPGLKAVRYVEILPSEERVYRYNVDESVESMKKRMVASRNAMYDETMLEWLPPLTIGIDWFVDKQWRETDPNKAFEMRHEETMARDQLKQLGEHSETHLRAMFKLSGKSDRDRRFPSLWTLEMLQSETGNPILRVRFYSDLTGVCHQKEPIEIRVPDELLEDCGAYIKFGLSIVSNLAPSAIDFGVLKAVVDHAKQVVDTRVDQAIQIHNMIANFNFIEQTGDSRVSRAARQAPREASAVGAVVGLDQGQAAALLEKLIQIATIDGDPVDFITSKSGLIRSTINATQVWVGKEELENHVSVLEVYVQKLRASIPQPMSAKLPPLKADSATGELSIQVSVYRVPHEFHDSNKFSLAVTFRAHGMDPCKQHLGPAYVGNRAHWRGRSIKFNVVSTIEQVREYGLELQPCKVGMFWQWRKIGKPVHFKFPVNCVVGDSIPWTVEWSNGQVFEFVVQLLANASHRLQT